MQAIDRAVAKRSELILFRTPGDFMSSDDAFFIASGDRIRITSGHNGSVSYRTCLFIDQYHFSCNGTVFHIDQFAEVMGRNGNKIEPEVTITDFSLYNKRLCDRKLLNEEGKPIPYREVVYQVDPDRRYNLTLSIAICPEASERRKVCVTTFQKEEPLLPEKQFMSLSGLQKRLKGDLGSILNEWDRKTLSDVCSYVMRNLSKPGIDSAIQDAAQRKTEHTSHTDKAPVQSAPEL